MIVGESGEMWRDERGTGAAVTLVWFIGLILLTFPLFTNGSFGEIIRAEEGIWQYALVFLFAGIPWIEVLVVIPPAIGLGLDPIPVAILAGVGNLLPVYAIIWFHGRIASWWNQRRGESGERSKRFRRSRRLWDRYGIIGLSLSSPILTGIHLATLVSLLFGASRRSVATWMTVTIVLWTVALSVGTVLGLSALG